MQQEEKKHETANVKEGMRVLWVARMNKFDVGARRTMYELICQVNSDSRLECVEFIRPAERNIHLT